MTPHPKKLAYGPINTVPEGAAAAWGARLIVSQDGWVDIVHDRQDLIAADSESNAALIVALTNSTWKRDLVTKLQTGEVDTRNGADVVVYEDDEIKVAGNSNGSYGYFYIAAWLK
jgi:hypothetical protein